MAQAASRPLTAVIASGAFFVGKVIRPDAFGGPREWKIERNAAQDSATIYLYGAIGFEENDASVFVRELEAITEQTINLRLNSPGGDVFDGLRRP